MKKLLIFGIIFLSLIAIGCKKNDKQMAFDFESRGCSGSDYCSACKNCSGCKHCAKEGGTCGVCSAPVKKKVLTSKKLRN